MRRTLLPLVSLVLVWGLPALVGAQEVAPPEPAPELPPLSGEQEDLNSLRGPSLGGFELETVDEDAELAEGEADGEGVERPRRRRARHFITEMNLGGLTNGGMAPALSILFGGGGRPGGVRSVLYLFGEYSYSWRFAEGRSETTGIEYVDERSYSEIGVGTRAYVPITRWLRPFVELGAGGTFVSALVEREGLPPRDAAGWVPRFQLGAGLQFRYSAAAALGLRLRVIPSGDDVGGLRELVGDDPSARYQLTLSTTWHF